jgi:high-affinity K+ transport system ATPase subunit B
LDQIQKYFAIIPAMFAAIYPGPRHLNIMGLHSPTSAILSAVIFNAIIIVLLMGRYGGVQRDGVRTESMVGSDESQATWGAVVRQRRRL